MKYILIILLAISPILAQDTMVMKSGVTYQGQYEQISDNKIYFKEQSAKYANGVPIELVKSVVLANGQVVYLADLSNSQRLENKNGPVFSDLDPAPPLALLGPSTPVQREDLQVRQTEVLEEKD